VYCLAPGWVLARHACVCHARVLSPLSLLSQGRMHIALPWNKAVSRWGVVKRLTSAPDRVPIAQDLVDTYQLMVPLDYVPQRQYRSNEPAANELSGKRGTAGMHAETSSKGSARGSKKSKAQVEPLAAVSLDDTDLSRCACAMMRRVGCARGCACALPAQRLLK